MIHEYPYLQTITGIDAGVKSYAIQPISEDDTNAISEENPIYSFGPLGVINIFVGATNAGKSRFLRSLAKAENYQFYSKELYQAVSNLKSCVRWFAKSNETIHFSINNHNGHQISGAPIVLYNMPGWIKEALAGVQSRSNYDLEINSDFFTKFADLVEHDVALQFSKEDAEKKRIEGNPHQLQKEFTIALWARNLLRGELLARIADQKKQSNGAIYYPDQPESFIRRGSPYLSFPIDSVSSTWQDKYLQLLDSWEYLRYNEEVFSEKPPQRIYIPTLRSAVSLSDPNGKRLTYDIFEQTVRRNYQLDDKQVKVFTGNRLYDTLRRDRNGTPEVVDRLRDFEAFLSTAFFEGRRVEIVALDKSYDTGQHISVRVQGESPRELHHLGDGINTLIILLYQLFMAQPGSWVFIEEPELNLHPGLQRIFLQTLLENEALQKRQLRIFFTTHSNHLLRMTLRDGTIASEHISVFAFQQRVSDKSQFLIRPLISEHHDALALLGVQNASVLLAQCGIWVEGITDRQYLRAYLNAYQNSDEFKKQGSLRVMREDTHFAFWEYAGSNLSHYFMGAIPRKGSKEAEQYDRGQKNLLAQIQSSALCNRIFLVADRDKKKEAKHTALRGLAVKHKNFAYYVTSGIEIENLLSPDEINACLPKLFNKKVVAPFNFKQSDYKDVGIGKFLQEKYPSDCPENLAAESGTLTTYRKNMLCELAVQHISWNTMSKEAKALAKELHAFIAKHNNI